MAVAADRIAEIPARSDRVLRHAGVDRLFHWLTALCVITLMATGLLPHMGVQFDWVNIHWVAGLGLVVLIVFHVLRSAVWRKLRAMWFSIAELRTHQVGKYSVAQKLMHHAMTAMALGAAITGVLMLKKIQTPLLVRDPYLFEPHTWGVIYVIHGLAALSAITLVIVHVYFGLIPENRMYLRAMITGWMSRNEQRARVAGIRAGEKHLT